MKIIPDIVSNIFEYNIDDNYESNKNTNLEEKILKRGLFGNGSNSK